MIPSRDTAHLVQDPAGNWVVVGDPKPAEGASPPPLNTKLPDPTPAPPPFPGRPRRGSGPSAQPAEARARAIPGATPLGSSLQPGANPEVLVRAPAARAPAPRAAADARTHRQPPRRLPNPLFRPVHCPGPRPAPRARPTRRRQREAPRRTADDQAGWHGSLRAGPADPTDRRGHQAGQCRSSPGTGPETR